MRSRILFICSGIWFVSNPTNLTVKEIICHLSLTVERLFFFFNCTLFRMKYLRNKFVLGIRIHSPITRPICEKKETMYIVYAVIIFVYLLQRRRLEKAYSVWAVHSYRIVVNRTASFMICFASVGCKYLQPTRIHFSSRCELVMASLDWMW